MNLPPIPPDGGRGWAASLVSDLDELPAFPSEERATHTRVAVGALCGVHAYQIRGAAALLYAADGTAPSCPDCARGPCRGPRLGPSRDNETAPCVRCGVYLVPDAEGRPPPHAAQRIDGPGIVSEASRETTPSPSVYFPTIASSVAPVWTIAIAVADGMRTAVIVELPEIRASDCDGDRAVREVMALLIEWMAASALTVARPGAETEAAQTEAARLVTLAARIRTERAVPPEVRAMFQIGERVPLWRDLHRLLLGGVPRGLADLDVLPRWIAMARLDGEAGRETVETEAARLIELHTGPARELLIDIVRLAQGAK